MSNNNLAERIVDALRKSGKPVLRVDHVAALLGTTGTDLLVKLNLLEEMEKAGMGSSPLQLVPWRNRAMYGVDFDKVLAKTVKTKNKGKEVSQNHYWPGVMLKSEERQKRLETIRVDAGRLVDAGWTQEYDVSHNANGIVLTYKSPVVTETADNEPVEVDADDDSDDE